jgi:hypothetical protein
MQAGRVGLACARNDVRWHRLVRILPIMTVNVRPGVQRQQFAQTLQQLQSGGIPRGPVTVEVLFDPPGHERLSIADDEIIARTVTAAAAAGRKITLITADTGQSMRGRAAGLKVVKIPRPPDGDEPVVQPRTTSAPTRRPARVP